MRHWLAAAVTVAILSVLIPTWATLWLVLGAMQDIDERRQDEDRARERQIEAVVESQECILRLMLVEPRRRQGLTVGRILDACPEALPERDEGDEPMPSPSRPDMSP